MVFEVKPVRRKRDASQVHVLLLAKTHLREPVEQVGYTRLEGVDIALNARRYVLEVGCILHALQGSEARRVVGLPKFVKGAPPVVYVQRTGLAGVLVMAHRMAAKRVDVDAIEQPVKLLGRQFDHLLMPSRPHETVFLKPTQQQPESGALVQQELDAIAEPNNIQHTD
jgi:hypothetical protein